MNTKEKSEHSVENLRACHEKVKNHPYRLSDDPALLKSYQLALEKLSSEFYWVIKETKYKVASNMCHDLNLAIINLSRETFKYLTETQYHVEYCISAIHKFLDTGVMETYAKLWFGGFLSELGHQKIYKWNDEIQGYYLYVPKNKLDYVVSALKKHIENEYKNEWSVSNAKAWEEQLKYLLRYNQ